MRRRPPQSKTIAVTPQQDHAIHSPGKSRLIVSVPFEGLQVPTPTQDDGHVTDHVTCTLPMGREGGSEFDLLQRVLQSLADGISHVEGLSLQQLLESIPPDTLQALMSAYAAEAETVPTQQETEGGGERILRRSPRKLNQQKSDTNQSM